MRLSAPERWLCGGLAAEADCTTADLLPPLADPDFDWEQVLRLAHRALVATPLYPALHRRGLWERTPPAVADHLAVWHRLNAERNARLRQELRAVTRLCNRLGVEPVLLKGGLWLLPGQSPEAAARLMGDVDLLIPAAQIDACQQALQTERGYYPDQPEAAHWQWHYHAPSLLHPVHDSKLELHRELFLPHWQPVLPAADVWRDSLPATLDGARLRIPTPTHWALHNLVHTLLKNRGLPLDLLELRQLYDWVLLRQAQESAIAWAEISRRLESRGQRTALPVYLLCAQTLFGQPLPAGIHPTRNDRWRAMRLLAGLRDARWLKSVRWLEHWLPRLGRLPRRLLTPGWYGMKYRALRRGERL